MKILEINKFYYPKRGAERHFFDVIQLLESAGHEVAVFSMEHENNPNTPWRKYFLSKVGYTKEYSVWEKFKGTLRMFYSLEAKNKINALLDDFRPDVVHIHNIYHQLSPMILFEIKKRNIPVVMTVHDFKIISPNHSLYLRGEFYDRCREGKYYQCFLDRCVKNSYAKSFLAMLEMYWHSLLGTYEKNIDTFIVPSEFVKKILVDRGIQESKIIVLPHFIADEVCIIEKESPSPPYALYVGAVSKNKGVDHLLEMFSEIPNLKIQIAGAVEDGIDLANSKNVKYHGHLQANKLRAVMSNASCIVSASRLPETFGLIALEAISMGKPFFGYRAGAFSEIIDNYENGFLAENQNSFREILSDFSKGNLTFESANIKKMAEKKYDKRDYLAKLSKILAKPNTI